MGKHRRTPSSSTTSPHRRVILLRATLLRDRLTLPSNSLLRLILAIPHSRVLLASHSGGRQWRKRHLLLTQTFENQLIETLLRIIYMCTLYNTDTSEKLIICMKVFL